MNNDTYKAKSATILLAESNNYLLYKELSGNGLMYFFISPSP